ncbi:MAG: gliding motility-associated C-terminal domain-containing protein [Bacteroidetes bacterium]|nr:gliding motility-associated C-terminal domain-containing protein [Bacteroidota bacterium]
MSNLRFFAIVAWLMLCELTTAQTTFQTVFGGTDDDYIFSLIQSDSGYLVAGASSSFSSPFFYGYLAKVDIEGNVLWSKIYGNPTSHDAIFSVIETIDNHYMLAGGSDSITLTYGPKAYLLKTDLIGNVVWSKYYDRPQGEPYALDLIETSDSSYILAGFFQGLIIPGAFKTDIDGDLQWAGGPPLSGGKIYSVLETKNDDYVFAGGEYIQVLSAFVFRTDTSGNIKWLKTYGILGQGTNFYSILQTPDSGFLVTGYEKYVGAGGKDVVLMKIDNIGNLLWVKTYGGVLDDEAQSIYPTKDGGYVLGGSTSSFGAGGLDFYLLKVDPNGKLLWSRTYGGTLDDICNDALQTNDGGFVMAGYTESFGAGGKDFYILKTDSIGTIDGLCFQDTAATTVNNVVFKDTLLNYAQGFYPFIAQPPVDNDSNVNLTDSFICCTIDPDFSVALACSGDSTIFIDLTYGNSLGHFWDYGDGVKDTFMVATDPKHVYPLPDTYKVTLIVVSIITPGCMDTISKTIVVYPSPDVFLPEDTSICPGETISLSAVTNDAFALSYVWSTGDTAATITATYPGNYSIAATNQYGCSAKDTVLITDDCNKQSCENSIFIPNAFSPNGDNMNDILYVLGEDINLFEFVIFNRWGQKVFTSSNINSGWDGTLNGKPINPSVFVWYLKAECLTDGEMIFKTGDVTLIR